MAQHRRALLLSWLGLALFAACGESDETPGNGMAGHAGAGNGGIGGSAGVSAGGGSDAGFAGASEAGAGSGVGGGSGATSGRGGAAGNGATSGRGGASAGGAGSGAGGIAAGEAGSDAGEAGQGGGGGGPVVLVFSRTLGFRHDSIAQGVPALEALGQERGWDVLATEDSAIFTDAGLAPFNVVVFLLTSGDVLDDAQQAAFERFIAAGNGFVGVHSAADTEYGWSFYGQLLGAYFRMHPLIQPATIHVEDPTHPSTTVLPEPWQRTDEWYAFDQNPRDRVHVLLTLDESSYSPGDAQMGPDHPIAWYHEFGGGRAFYTALGHTAESYSEAPFLEHVAGAIAWAAGR